MMRIKTYTSESVPQALRMIREDLGPGAVILKTNRTVKKRFWGLFPSTAYEITAATDPSAGEKGPGEAAEEAVAGPLPREERPRSSRERQFRKPVGTPQNRRRGLGRSWRPMNRPPILRPRPALLGLAGRSTLPG